MVGPVLLHLVSLTARFQHLVQAEPRSFEHRMPAFPLALRTKHRCPSNITSIVQALALATGMAPLRLQTDEDAAAQLSMARERPLLQAHLTSTTIIRCTTWLESSSSHWTGFNNSIGLATVIWTLPLLDHFHIVLEPLFSSSPASRRPSNRPPPPLHEETRVRRRPMPFSSPKRSREH